MALNLDNTADELLAVLDETFVPGAPQAGAAAGAGAGLASDASVPVAGRSEGQGSLPTSPGSDPNDLEFPDYIQKVKEAFVRSKSLKEIELHASSMGFRDWMDYFLKMIPKDVKIQGEFNFKHLVAEFGPVNKEQFRVGAAEENQILDVEVEDLGIE